VADRRRWLGKGEKQLTQTGKGNVGASWDFLVPQKQALLQVKCNKPPPNTPNLARLETGETARETLSV
jgi:hypothetical protein